MRIANVCSGNLNFLWDFSRFLFSEFQERSVKFSSVKFHINMFGNGELISVTKHNYNCKLYDGIY